MDKLVVTLWITFGLYLMVLFAIFADLWSGVRKAKKNSINLLDGTERNANKYSSDMEKIDQILESLYDRVIEPTEAKEQLLDLFAVSSRNLVSIEIKDELQRRIGIIESETDDFTRQSMISNLTIDLIK